MQSFFFAWKTVKYMQRKKNVSDAHVLPMRLLVLWLCSYWNTVVQLAMCTKAMKKTTKELKSNSGGWYWAELSSEVLIQKYDRTYDQSKRCFYTNINICISKENNDIGKTYAWIKVSSKWNFIQINSFFGGMFDSLNRMKKKTLLLKRFLFMWRKCT